MKPDRAGARHVPLDPPGARSYSFVMRAAARSGAIAQLGERVNGIHEVGGSIPPGSTIPSFERFSIFPVAYKRQKEF